MSDAYEYKDNGLQALIKALKESGVKRVKVGILGDRTTRTQGNNTNAEIGKKHEFGDENLPVRSFLRMPIIDQLQKYLEKAGALTPQAVKEVISTRSVIPWLRKIGVVAEQTISDAFNSGGFGKWKPSDMSKKKNHQTLVETQQLRNSITSEVEE